MNIPKGTYNVLRSVVVTALVTVVVVFALAYLLLLLPPVQDRLCREGEKALGDFLKTEVVIGGVDISPFNQVELNNVLIKDQQGDSLLTVETLGAGISLKDLIADHRIVITAAEILGLEGHVTRPDKDSPTNIQFIIDAFKPKDDKPPKPFDVQVNTVVMRRSALTYDVLDQPHQPGRLDPNHLAVSNLRADLSLPRLKNNDFDIRVKRLSFDEASGLSLKQLATDLHITDKNLDATGINIQLPHSNINIDDIHLAYSSLKNLGNELKTMPLAVSTPGSTVTPSDFAALAPRLRGIDDPLRIAATVARNGNRIEFPRLTVRGNDGTLALDARGGVTLPAAPGGYQALDLDRIALKAGRGTIARVTGLLPGMSPQARNIIARCGDVKVDGALHGTPAKMTFDGTVGTSLGDAGVNGTLAKQQGATHFAGHVKTSGLKVGTLLDKQNLLGEVALDARVDATLRGSDVSGHLDGSIPFVDIKGTRYHNITANIDKQGKEFIGTLAMNDPNGRVNLDGKALLDGANSTWDVNVQGDGLSLARLGITDKFPDRRLAVNATASFWGDSPSNATGHIQLNDVAFADTHGHGLHLDHLQVNADNNGGAKVISVSSDHVNGFIEGQYDFKTIVPAVKHILASAFPQYFGQYAHYSHGGEPNDVNFDFVITPDDAFNDMLNLPVQFYYRATVKGALSESAKSFDLTVDAPYLLQGNKIIEGTRLTAALDNTTGFATANLQATYPLKTSKAALNIDLTGHDNRLDANLGWRLDRQRDFYGNLSLSGLLDRGSDGKLKADIDVNPSTMAFNDTIWNVEPGRINVEKGVITVDNLAGGHNEQYIRINGKASKDPDDELCLELNDVSLDYVFESLAIDHVNFGGRATSKCYASELFSGSPRLYTPSLYIKNMAYNGALMGDGNIKANFDTKTRGVMLDCDLAQRNGHHSNIYGGIYIADDSLDIIFDTDHANIAFLKPYMVAFTSDVEGEVSGKANLFGNFHTINLKGDVVADSLKFFIDYVNCYYTASNAPVHCLPNLIQFNDIPIHDREGHEAKLGGWLKHDAFHKPEFNFAITDAKNFLSYDTNPVINPDWYGTIYGNGACFVEGVPGMVQIRVNMTSAPHSKFTLVMSDSEQADNYNFITFRDRNAPPAPDPQETAQRNDTLNWILSQLQQKVQQEEQSEPSAYLIDLQGDITPDVDLTVVMDPVGGDRIKATGSGHMRMTYNNNGELTTYGKYTLDKGTYNFTLQDVIIKDFVIRDGSSISFQGDPYAGVLDLEAVYSLNANLKDLDESFGEDRELNRTNVPVHALLQVKGIISQPEISFDLEFPSLTTDAYRKVKSIISTPDMMNRQIIYLLALNRFYTPEYMGTTTNQNELITSVASSTISSQLSNILGKMTDNLSIAPNFRSDKGDFSDMEVDVALSSQLLNNRLLLNGNFGYRDNTYNTSNTNFIGDFDIEYLLNSKGSIRLKAYNHFNDQNYYLRNALTTQGVGIVWKHDFDRLFRKEKKPVLEPAKADSLPRKEQGNDSNSVRQPVPMVTLRSANHNDNPNSGK